MIDFSTILFRCSSLGYIMTEPRNKNELLSETCKTHLIDVYVRHKYGRQSDISNKYTEKGLMVEEDSITLYSRVKKKLFTKNERHLSNECIKGTPDLFIGHALEQAEEVIDIKSSWDIFSFFRVHTQLLNKHYYWQLQGYMALTGASTSTLAYCLVNTPQATIMDEKRKLFYKMNVATDENDLYKEACTELEKAMIYDDIPIKERVIEISVERNDMDIEHIYKRVEDCRCYLSELQNELHGVQPPSIPIIDTTIRIDIGDATKKNKKRKDERNQLCINQRCV